MPEIIRKMGISEVTFYRWKKRGARYVSVGLIRREHKKLEAYLCSPIRGPRHIRRMDINLGVAYKEDVGKVMSVLKDIAKKKINKKSLNKIK